jgi:S-adenosylmethionine decarboxylase
MKKKTKGAGHTAIQSAGIHLLIDFWEADNLNSVSFCRKALARAVEACDATLLSIELHKFSPHGVSGVAVISESHISIHTWPEHNYAALDIFVCGDKDPYLALKSLKYSFQPKRVNLIEAKRGIFS